MTINQPREIAPPTNALAIAAFVVGLITLGLTLMHLTLWLLAIPALVTLIFGFIGVNTANRLAGKRRALAIIAVLLGFSPLWYPLVFAAATGREY